MTRGLRFHFFLWPALLIGVSPSACMLFGQPKCDSGEETQLSVDTEVSWERLADLEPATSEDDCEALCELFARRKAKAKNYRFDGISSCRFEVKEREETAGNLTCTAETSHGGCTGQYEEPEGVGGAGGSTPAGGAGN